MRIKRSFGSRSVGSYRPAFSSPYFFFFFFFTAWNKPNSRRKTILFFTASMLIRSALMTRSRLANVNRIREPSKDQKDHLWSPLRKRKKKNNHKRLVILWRMHLQERFQSLGNGCQRSFLFPSTLSARFSSFRCVYYTTVLYYALSTTADRKSSHKWRRKEREREREEKSVPSSLTI